MGDPGAAEPVIVEVRPDQLRAIGCAVCGWWTAAVLPASGVLRCRRCGHALMWTRAVLEHVGGDTRRLWH